MNVRYKASAKLDDRIVIETQIAKVSPVTITFAQTIKNAQTGQVFIIADFETVAVNNNGKIYRRMPEILKNAFEGSNTMQRLNKFIASSGLCSRRKADELIENKKLW